MNLNSDIFKFTIYREPSVSAKCRKEAEDLANLLRRLSVFINFDDVRSGQPPAEPDFILHYQGKKIGAELTDLDPKMFEKHGFIHKGKFKNWLAKTQSTTLPQKFNWGNYSLRESLAAFKAQLEGKKKKAANWFGNFPERWLLMHVAPGSPFSQIFDVEWQKASGRENEVADFFAKTTYCIYTICQEIYPFDYIFLFMQESFLTFPARPENPRNLPVPTNGILKRGAQVSDKFLDWSKDSNYVVVQESGADINE